jgi:hypothetical protein
MSCVVFAALIVIVPPLVRDGDLGEVMGDLSA